MLFFYGRALWRGLPTAGLWLAFVVFASFLASAANLADVATATWVWGWCRIIKPVQTDNRVLAAVFWNAGHLPWLAMLLTGVWVLWWRRHKRFRSQPWVSLAVAWCLSISAASLCEGFASRLPYLGPPQEPGWWSLIHRGSPIAVALGLLLHTRVARLLALIMAATQIVLIAIGAYNIGLLTYSSIEILFVNIGEEAPFWTCFLFNSGTFLNVFVETATYAGPWFLIAIYAWRVPMGAFKEDGSPYPRRYCGKCYYNLQGLDGPRCPECGSVLDVEPAADPV